MKRLSAWFGVASLAAVVVTSLAPDVDAGGGKPKAPHMSAPHPAHVSQPHVNRPQNVNRQAMIQNQMIQRQMMIQNQVAQRQMMMKANAIQQRQRASLAYNNYRAGVQRNRSYGYARRYATSNRNVQMVVRRLRSTQTMLARLDHDYQGHRVRAMHAISTAIRNLSHTSIRNYGSGASGIRTFASGRSGVSNRNRTNIAGHQRLPQAQSDAQMRRAMQSLQMVNQQLTSQGTTSNHYRARAAVQHAQGELMVALRVR